jgi:S1-C subfamily serine protease
MEAIVELGGRVEYDRQVPVFTGTPPTLQLVIGPKWTGGVEGLGHLSAVRRATTVSFYSSAISGDEAAAEISTLTQLQRVEFYGTKISDESLAKLRELLPPATVIDVRGPARLGIAGTPAVVGGAGVGAVDPGTAAEKAGLIPGDIITEIQGVAVADFEALTREIAKCEAGDSISLAVLRPSPGGQPMPKPITLTVTFARWGDEEAVNPSAPNPLGGAPLGMPARVLINRR